MIALGIFLASLWLGAVMMSAFNLALQQTRLQVLADTLAIAASDSRAGLISGLPCESAKDLALLSKVDLQACSIVGESIHISLTVKSLGIVLSAEAIAEPMH